MSITIWDILSYILCGPVLIAYTLLDRLSFDLAVRDIFGHSEVRTKVYHIIQPPRNELKKLLLWCIGDEE